MAEQVQAAATEAPAAVKSPLSSQSQSQDGSAAASASATEGSAQIAASQDGTAKTADETTVARPEGIPDTYWDAEKNTLKLDPVALAKDLKERDELKTFKAAEDVKALSRPQTPEAYKIELPADFKVPVGLPEFTLNQSDPAFGRLKAVAHKHGLAQEAVTELVSVYAENQVALKAAQVAEYKGEVDKLGTNGPARVDALTNFFAGIDTTPDKRDAAALAGSLTSAAVVEAWERIVTRQSTQGAASFSQSHRVVPDNKPSDEEFSNWSYGEQREFHSTGKRPQRAAA